MTYGGRESEPCACGRPLHYGRECGREAVEKIIARLGPTVVVCVWDREYRVPRHFLALHELTREAVARYGFPEVTRPKRRKR